jgi:transcriptional regulator with XRE-family HTH domain
MDQGLTPTCARELGRAFRFARLAREITLREAAKRSSVSTQYILNIEQGSKVNVSEEVLRKLSRGLGVPPVTTDNLLLRARVLSALERRGLNMDQRGIIWTSLEQRLKELDIDVRESVRDMVAELY